MIKHKVKYRVVGADRSKRKYSINLDEGTTFQLSRALLQGVQTAPGDTSSLCSFQVQSGVMQVQTALADMELIMNGRKGREFTVRPGDLVQVDEFSIEILECPHVVQNETNATQFLDVSEMFSGNSTASAPVAPKLPTAEASPPPEAYGPSDYSAPHPESSASRATLDPVPQKAALPTRGSVGSEDRLKESIQSKLDSHKAHPRRKDRYTPEVEDRPRHGAARSSETPWTPEMSHLATSLAMAGGGAAGIARILLSASGSPQSIIVLYAALGAVLVTFGLSLGLTRLGPFLGTSWPMQDYARFLGWTLLCSIGWAYALGSSFTLAVFTTLLALVMLVMGFILRFRPNVPRFLGLSGALSALSIVGLFAAYHPEQMAHRPGTDAASETEASTPQAAVAPVSAPAQQQQLTQAQGTAPAVVPPPQEAAPAPVAVQPVQPDPALISAVRDAIPPIPPAPANVARTAASQIVNPGRMPAAADPAARSVVDPLAQEQFFSAIKIGNLDVVRSLVERKVIDPDFTLDKSGNTALIVAAGSGKLKVVEYLVKRRVNINAQDPHGTTALMWATFKGHREVARYLVKKGANTGIRRDDGDSALDIARKWKQNDIAELIEDRQGSDSVRNHRYRKHRR